MTTQLFSLDRLEENPWNERPLDEANVATIAASLESDGLLQNPVGRIHPADPGRVQLAYGHHRLAAFRRLAAADPGNERWQLIPVDVRVIDDKQMARQAIIENHHRQDPSGIEKARALLRLTKEFGETQEAAGAVFGMGQAAVSHLLRLLKLPAEIQELVNRHELPERLARQLVSLSRVKPKEAAKIANKTAKAPADERDATFEDEFNQTVREMGRWLNNVPWDEAWPAQPIPLTDHKSVKEIPACKGCEFAVRSRFHGPACIRPECFSAKEVEHAWTKAAEVAKKLGIAVAGRTEKVVDLIGGYQADMGLTQRAVKAAHASLRVVPATGGDYYLLNNRRALTGNGNLTIATVDRTAVTAAFPQPKVRKGQSAKPAKKRTSTYVSEYKLRRDAADAMLAAAAPHIAEVLPADSRAVGLLWAIFGSNYLDKRHKDAWEKATTPAARRLALVGVMLEHVDEGSSWMNADDVRAGIVELTTAAKIKLPAGWDAAAVPAPKPAPAGTGHVRSHTRPAPKPSAAKPVGASTGKPTRRAAQQRAQAAAASSKKGGRK